MAKNYILDFREVNRDTFDLVCAGSKDIETRAASEQYADIAPGDTITFLCGNDTCAKEVEAVEKFPSIEAIFQKYKPKEINPTWKSEQDGRDAWASFPNYTEKIQKYGLIALTLKK
jgi:ASC-1-like (ASCH) protein